MLSSRESGILERSALESDILPPTPQPWFQLVVLHMRGKELPGDQHCESNLADVCNWVKNNGKN